MLIRYSIIMLIGGVVLYMAQPYFRKLGEEEGEKSLNTLIDCMGAFKTNELIKQTEEARDIMILLSAVEECEKRR